MSDHPYKYLPDKAFWRRSVSTLASEDIDPVGLFEIRLQKETKIATAGSCFAQHIARHLQQSGFNYYVVETGHPILNQNIREKYHYGTFSARYGNIYTARQLLQLLWRAYYKYSPVDDVWIELDGSVLDPFRPTVQPRGFISVAEMRADRAQHLRAVRTMFETLDVFVFTLGLTECWKSSLDGAVYPLCPGVEGGKFDPEKHLFHNQDVGEVISDMAEFIDSIQTLNPKAQIVLTVSPVPLMATADSGAHVLSATTYSKSVLRVATETLRRKYSHVHYFPSYEIITGAFNRGRYYAQDLRNVTEEGVSHVMRIFLQHAAAGIDIKFKKTQKTFEDDYLIRAEEFVDVECDEILLDK